MTILRCMTQRAGDGSGEGKYRKRADIRLDSAETSPRARFRFECKRLGRGYPAGRYLGAKGLGCFLRGDFACQDPRAGMLGYVQSDDEFCLGRQDRSEAGGGAGPNT